MLQTQIQIRKEKDCTLAPKLAKASRKASDVHEKVPDVHKKALVAAKRIKLLISFVNEASCYSVTNQNYLPVNISLLSPLLMGGLTAFVEVVEDVSSAPDLIWCGRFSLIFLLTRNIQQKQRCYF